MSKSKVYQHSAKWNRADLDDLDEWVWEDLHEVADALRSGLSEMGATLAIDEIFVNHYGEAYAHSPVGKRNRANAVRFYLERVE